MSNAEYQRLADPWPLNPEGELLVGLKIEDRHALQNAEASTAVPGVGFAEWGPGDMSMSYNVSRAENPQVLVDARARVFAATRAAGIPFLNGMNADNIIAMIDEGVRIGSNPGARGGRHGPPPHRARDALVAPAGAVEGSGSARDARGRATV